MHQEMVWLMEMAMELVEVMVDMEVEMSSPILQMVGVCHIKISPKDFKGKSMKSKIYRQPMIHI